MHPLTKLVFSFIILAFAVKNDTAVAKTLGHHTLRPYIEWSEWAAETWKPDDTDDIAIMLLVSGEITYGLEWHTNIAEPSHNTHVMLSKCRNGYCSVRPIDAKDIQMGLLKDSVEASELDRGINEFTYELFLWVGNELVDTDVSTIYLVK